MKKILIFVFISFSAALGQQINPQTGIRWGQASGCQVMGLVWAPANDACVPAGGASKGWISNLGAAQGSTDTTATLTSTVGLPPSGTFYIDSEWETYSGISGSQLTGLTRGVNGAASSHNYAAQVYSVNSFFNPTSQTVLAGVFGTGNGTFNQAQMLSTNCGTPPEQKDRGTNYVSTFLAFQTGCLYPTWIDSGGSIHQNALGTIGNYMSPIYVSPYYSDSYATGGGAGLPIPISNTSSLVQYNIRTTMTVPIGLGAGAAGDVAVQTPATIGAPTLTGQAGGSCAITYEVIGHDSDGGVIPGTTATISNLTFPAAGLVYIQGPSAAGAVSYDVYRTAVSSCGTFAIGKFTTTLYTNYPFFQDTGQTGDGTTPPSASSVEKLCVGGTTGKLYCQTAGTSTTPNFTCASGTQGWQYHITSATASPFVKICNGTSFVTAY